MGRAWRECVCAFAPTSPERPVIMSVSSAMPATEDKSRMPVLVLGCGVIARYHLKAMGECERFTVAAVADGFTEAASKFADEVAVSPVATRAGERPATFASLDDALAADPNKELFGAVFILVSCAHVDQ